MGPEERGEVSTASGGGGGGGSDSWWLTCAPEALPGRGSIAARRKLAARLASEGKLAAPSVAPAAGGADGGGALSSTAAIDLSEARRHTAHRLGEGDSIRSGRRRER